MILRGVRSYNLGQMSAVFAQAAVSFYARAQAGLNVAAGLILERAQEKFGHYQTRSGPHPAWAELADATKQERQAQGFTPNEPLLRSGALKGSFSKEVWGLEAVIGSTDPRMVYHETGSRDGKLPPRPVLGPTAFETKEEVAAILGNVAISAVLNGAEVRMPGYASRHRFRLR